MNLLLVFLLGLFAYAVATAGGSMNRPRTVTLLGICALVALGYTARRII